MTVDAGSVSVKAAPRAMAPSARSLWLPLRARRSVWAASLALLAVYVATMARDLSLYDSGEIALAAVQLGLGHPPGQPLHTLFGHLLAHVPGLTPLVGVTLASALPSAFALLPAASLAQRLTPDADRTTDRIVPWLLAAIALHAAMWEPATRVEVYALATFFALWALARFDATPSTSLLTVGIALGSCASVNPMIALCTGIALLPALWPRLRARATALRSIGTAVLGGVIGLLPYAYVPLVAGRSDVMVWGAPTDGQSLWHYFSLRDYAHNQQITSAIFFDHVAKWLVASVERGLLPVLVLGVTGHIAFGRRGNLGRAVMPLSLVLLVAVTSSYVVWDVEIPDYDGYLATAAWLAAGGAAALFGHAWGQGRRAAAIVLAALLAVASALAPPNVFARTRHQDHLARALAERVLAEAPKDALVIAHADVFAGSLFYLQEIEQQRPDVVVLAYGLASSRWHWDRIAQRHPDLAPFELRGPGGRAARVARWLAANPRRPVLVERLGIAAEVGVQACTGGLYLRAGPVCQTPPPRMPQSAASLLAHWRDTLGDGSPSAAGAIALTAYTLGESLWRLGEPEAARQVLLAGVPAAHQPEVKVDASAAPALRGHLPAWRRGAALGDPARNLFLVAALLNAAGHAKQAAAYQRAAAELGLPEALAAAP